MFDRVHKRKIATDFVEAVNARTFCANCGKQPIEWHHDDHPSQPNARVSSLRTQGASIERIRREMDRCTPYCRSCHMAADGRALALHMAQPNQKGVATVDPKPCVECGVEVKPTRRGRCSRCYCRLMGIRQPKQVAGS